MTDPTTLNQTLTALKSNPTGTTSSATSSMSSALGKDDFLKLLVGQLQHQDPLAPSDDQQWIGQMAQFSQLEQVSNTAQTTTRIADALGRSGALGLIGHTVTYTDADDNAVTGTVTQVDMDKDGKGGVDAGAVTQVR